MKHKKIIAFIMALFATVTVFTGCSASRIIFLEDVSSNREVTEITLYGYKADNLDFTAIENIMHGFMNENETIQMSYEGAKGQSYWNALELRDKAGRLDDLIMVDQEHVITLKDILSDVKDSIDLSVFTDLVKTQILKPDGSIRFVPITLASYCLYVNYDLLSAHNFSAPENFEEFSTICEYFKNKGVTPVICNTRRSLCSLVQGKSLFDVYQQPNSGDIIEEYNENPALLAEKLGEGIDFIEMLFDNGWVDRAATLNTLQTSTDKEKNGDLYLFSKGEQPFLVSGGWAPQRLKKLLSDNGQTLNFGVHPYPILDDGCVLVMDVNNCVAVNKNSQHESEAKNFLSYLTKPDSIWEYCDGQCCFSPLKNETRIPTEESVAPTAPYYSNGRAVIGTNYQLNMPLDSYLMSVTSDMCKGDNAETAKRKLTKLLTGKEA